MFFEAIPLLISICSGGLTWTAKDNKCHSVANSTQQPQREELAGVHSAYQQIVETVTQSLPGGCRNYGLYHCLCDWLV